MIDLTGPAALQISIHADEATESIVRTLRAFSGEIRADKATRDK